MNKTASLIVLFCLVASGALFAQDAQDAQDEATDDSQMSFVAVVTYHIKMPEGGSWDKFKEMLTEYHENVTLKNDLIVGNRILRHVWGSNSSDFIVIYEYAEWGHIQEASEVSGKLTNEYWPRENQRERWFDEYNSYFDPVHSDEIYYENTALRK